MHRNLALTAASGCLNRRTFQVLSPSSERVAAAMWEPAGVSERSQQFATQ